MSVIRSPCKHKAGIRKPREIKVWCAMRARELPASGYALEVNSRPKAAFAFRDSATAVEEAVKAPNASDSNL
jgi:hypothetical protein